MKKPKTSLPRISLIWSILFLWTLFLLPQAAAQDKCDDPLPKDIIIIPPDPSVPEDLAKFSGTWKGRWAGALCSSFVVELVEATGNVRYVYSWGQGTNFRAGYSSGHAKIQDGKLRWGERTKFTWWINDEYLEGDRFSSGRHSYITMRKVSGLR